MCGYGLSLSLSLSLARSLALSHTHSLSPSLSLPPTLPPRAELYRCEGLGGRGEECENVCVTARFNSCSYLFYRWGASARAFVCSRARARAPVCVCVCV